MKSAVIVHAVICVLMCSNAYNTVQYCTLVHTVHNTDVYICTHSTYVRLYLCLYDSVNDVADIKIIIITC